MRNRRLGWLAALLGVLLFASSVQAQGAADHVTWTATVTPKKVAPGASLRLQLEAEIGTGWKMYAMDSPPPTQGIEPTLEELPAAFAAPGEWQQAEPREGHDPNFQKTVRYFQEQARLWKPLAVQPKAAPGTYELAGRVRYMICNKRLCLPPTSTSFQATVTVRASSGSSADSAATSATADTAMTTLDFTGGSPPLSSDESTSSTDTASVGAATPGPTDADGTQRAGTRGVWAFLLLAVGAGAAALLTPCVFPMIPLTVSYFTKHAGNRSQSVRMALVYGGAIVGTFTGLGVLTALLVGAAGARTIAADPWVNLFIGAVFVVFALSLLGLFELRLPSSLLNYFNRQSSERAGYGGVLFMGLTLTLVSFSCTAPFVGGLLAATAQGTWREPVLGMLVFSLVFSLPFVGFALFPNALGSLPNSGSWMNAVKVTLGFVELAAALKFLSNADLIWGWGLLSRPLAIALTVVIFSLAGLYLIGKLPLHGEPQRGGIGVGRLLSAVGFFGLALYMLPGLLGAPLGRLDAYLPPKQAQGASQISLFQQSGTERAEAQWHERIEPAFDQARTENKPVFVDFTGYTCTNCREMEANVFLKPPVARRFQEDFVLLRLYTDEQERGPALQRYQLDLTGTVALPTYAVVSPQDQNELIAQHSGVASTEEFAAFLDRGAARFREQQPLAMR